MKTQIDNAFVMSATVSQLQAVAGIIGMSEAQVQKALSKGKLAAVVGTKLANDPAYSASFADASLTMDIPEPTEAEAAAAAAAHQAQAARDNARQAAAAARAAAKQAAEKAAAEKAAAEKAAAGAQPEPGKRAANVSAKAWIRELLSKPGAEYTLAELISLTGKTEVNIRTMLSDLRSPKYCGKGGVFATKSVRRGQKVYYSKA